jgi:hypothetical protein
MGAWAQEPARPDTGASVTHELSLGGMIRVKRRDPGLVGGGNGGTGTSVNFDDSNLDYGRGFTAFGLQGRSAVDAWSALTELRIEAVYFYDFINADGNTDFRRLSREARDRAGANAYLNDAYVGYLGRLGDAKLVARVGNQVLRWSESLSFGPSIAPVNPVSGSRRYQPGNAAADALVAVPMLSFNAQTPGRWTWSGFYQLAFSPTEVDAAGTFLGSNDYYSPGARYLQLGQGSPLVPDLDASFITPATPFGSRVQRGPDRRPGRTAQLGLRIEAPPMQAFNTILSGYAMQVHAREPIVSVHTGTLGGLLRVTAPDYTSSGDYFVEYVPRVTVLGASAKLNPAEFTRLALDYSIRIRQPLQIDDDLLITAGLAPAAATAACAANPASPGCAGTLAALNRNALIAARGGITLANASSFFAVEIPGYERFKVSQYAISFAQGLPPSAGAKQWFVAGEIGGLRIHGFRDRFLDASVTVRPDDTGARRLGFATRSAWGYRLTSRMEFAGAGRFETLAPFVAWIHDVKGNAPITLGTFLEKNRSAIVGSDLRIDKTLSGRIAYRAYLGKGTNADRFTDRDFIQFSLTKRF